MTTLQQIIEKYNMVSLAHDEMSDFERDILKCAEQEPTNTKLMLMEANINGYTQGLKDSSKAEQEPKTGHWEDLHRCWICSECGQETHIEHKYCPNCGAKMFDPQESEE